MRVLNLSLRLCFIFIFIFILFLSFHPTANCKTKHSDHKEKLDAIELIEGVPSDGRKYKSLGPVAGTCSMVTSMRCAVKLMKKEALKLGANAIIKIETGTSKKSGAAFVGGVFAAGADEHASVKGWAIKWTK